MMLGVHFNFVKRNLLLILKLQKTDFLVVKKGGQLEKVEGRLRRKTIILNALFLNQQSKKALKAIVSTFTVFLHEMKNPLDLKALKLTFDKTLYFANQALLKISLHPKYYIIENVIKALIDDYEKKTLKQIDIISDLQKAVSNTLKKPHFIYQDALEGMKSKAPTKATIGASGAYLMYGKKRGISGVFKPFDEEIGAPNNPSKRAYRGPIGSKLQGYQTFVGKGIFKEVAAFRVSEILKLGIVPHTSFAKFKSDKFHITTEGFYLRGFKEKIGSLQEFYAGYKHFYEFSKSNLENLPVDQLHRIFVLDVVIGNMDRNFANLLTNGLKIVAIDHGLCLSDRQSKLSIDALKELPQFNIPVFGSLKDKVLSICPESLKKILRNECFIEEKSLNLMVDRIKILKHAVALDRQVGDIISLFSSKEDMFKAKKAYAVKDA